jgi:RNA polymerase sigma factor (sigma-70 family)
MGTADSTCWTLLRDAAAGDEGSRGAFAMRYEGAVRSYLAARWRGSGLIQELDDAVQEVFIECLRSGGLLDRADSGRAGGFRAYLYGAARNVALRVEGRRKRQSRREPGGSPELEAVPAGEDSLSRVFDRAWASAVVREAAGRQAEQAVASGEAALKRVELLRLRFREGMPIREIARAWGADPAQLHREYARARAEFRAALREIVASQHPDAPDRVDRECAQLLDLLQ